MTSPPRAVQAHPQPTIEPGDHSATSRRPLLVFLAVAFALPWLLWLLRLVSGLDILAAGGMAAVGIATFVTVRWFRPRTGPAIGTGLRAPFRWRTTVKQSALAFAGMLGLAIAAIAIGAVAGVYSLDLDQFSGLRMVHAAGPADPVPVLLLSSLAQSILLFVVILPLAFCEEWGWRGFLLPRLRPIGAWPALVLSGLIWGVWHLPGYVGPDRRPGLVPFLVFCVLLGILFGWLRLTTRSVWPSTVAHAANNTVVIGFVNVVPSDADQVAAADPWSFGLSGWPGWIAMATAIVLFAAAGRALAARKPSAHRAA
ncbi:lysostaphin resistance A-like protein [Plantactinospora sp. CA-290183]|uniref:CPBP family intramembrane glutamic endopeptidase n=1 Tax=Plantactinospora sp. CA-290183 TaxID=3240006 RepID=UPI003D8AA055